MLRPSQGTVHVESNQQHGYELKLGHIARREKDWVVVLGKVFAALISNLRVDQQFVIQSEVYCGCCEKANIPCMVDGLGMFQRFHTASTKEMLEKKKNMVTNDDNKGMLL